MTRNELRAIAEKRLEEAECLFTNQFFDGAYYLGGYAIETALKARICNLLNCNYPPLPGSLVGKAYKMHDLKDLFFLGGLEGLLNADPNFINLKSSWSIIINWNEQQRYTLGGQTISSVREFLDAIGNANNGILP